MRSSFYAVEFLKADGSSELSRSFATKRAAEKWAREFSRLYAGARVMRGGPGGEEVCRFARAA